MKRLGIACATGVALAGFLALPHGWAAERFPGIGRSATPAEIAAWDIDVRPDFLGLPKGSGNVDQGQEIWEAKCASCHGVFGESNQVFTPIIGGTTKEDTVSGNVANLKRTDYPQRTTFMKVPTLSTLFDYVRRAMPWNEPKSLEVDEVYAVLAFMLNLADVVPADFELNERTIRDVQEKMPNRNGMTTAHAMWPGSGFGSPRPSADTGNTACKADCRSSADISSRLPDHALPAHGNIASQNRRIGPVRGRVTGTDDPDAVEDLSSPQLKLATESGCMACHGVNNKIVGPGYTEVANKYKGQDMVATLSDRIRKGNGGIWGQVAMPPQESVSDMNIKTLVEWILAGAPAR